MSQTIDNRVVQLSFDNDGFEEGAQESLSTLQKLKNSLKLDEAAKNLTALGKAAGNFTLDGISYAAEEVGNKFSYMKYMGLVALSNLVTGAMQAGKRFASAMIGPITSGGWNRAMNLEQANFMMKGLLKTDDAVAAVMADVSESVDGTAYSLDAAAKVAAQFAASGVKAGDNMLPALKAVAGTAAMTNSSFEEIGSIFTTVAGQGKLMTYQMRQLEFRGLNVAATLGEQLGKSEAEIRDMVSKGKISFEMFSDAMNSAFGEHAKEANNTFDGAMSNVRAALGRIGAEFATPFIHNAIPVLNSFRLAINATKKTLTPFFSESASLMETFSKKISGYIDGYTQFVTRNVDGIKRIFTHLITIIKNVSRVMSEITKPIKEAFDATFERSLISIFQTLAIKVEKFTNALSITGEQSEKIKHIFKGFFSIFDTVGTIIQRTVSKMGGLAPIIRNISDHLVNGLMKISDILLDVNTRVKDSDFFDKIPIFFDKLQNALANVGTLGSRAKNKIIEIKDTIVEFFKSNLLDPEGFSENVQKIKDFFAGILEHIKNFTREIPDMFNGLFKGVSTIGEAIVRIIESLFKGIVSAIKGFLSSDILAELFKLTEHSVFMLILSDLRNFSNGLKKANIGQVMNDFFSGPLSMNFKLKIPGLTELPTILKNFTNAQIDIQTISAIGKAMLELAAALFVVSMVDENRIKSTLGTFAALMVGMVAAIRVILKPFHELSSIVLKKGESTAGGGMMSVVAVIMSLAAAMLILAAALKVVSSIDTPKMIASLVAIEALIFSMVAAFKLLMPTITKFTKTIARYNGSIKGIKQLGRVFTSLALSVLILSAALVILSKIPFTSMIKALMAFGVLIVGLTGSIALLGSVATSGNLKHTGTQLLALSIGMIAMAAALKILASIPFTSMVKALVAFGAALFGMTMALQYLATTVLNSSSLVAAGASLMMVAVALIAVSAALKLMSTIEDTTGPIILLAVSLIAMSVAIGKLAQLPASKLIAASAAMVLASVALIALSAALLLLSAIPVDKLGSVIILFGTGVLGMAVALGALAQLPIPNLLAASAAMVIVGAALVLMSASMTALALVPWDALLKAGIIILGLCVALAALSSAAAAVAIGAAVLVVAFGSLALGIFLIGGALVSLGTGIKAIATGIFLLTTCMSALRDSMPILIEVVDTLKKMKGMLRIAVGLGLLGAAFVIFGLGAMTVGAGLSLIAAGMAAMASTMVSFSENFSKAGQIMIESREQVNAFIITMLKLAAISLLSPLVLILGAAFVVLGAGLTLVGTGLVTTAAGMELMMLALMHLSEFLQVVIPLVKEGFAKAWEAVKTAIHNAWEFIKNIDWDAVKAKLKEVGAWIKEKAKALWEWLKQQFPIWMEALKAKLAEWWEALKAKLHEKWEELKGKIKEKWEEFKDNIGKWKDDLIEKGKNIIQGLIDGILEKWKDIKAIPGKIRDAILGGIDEEFDINSPSKETYWRGLMTGEGYNMGLEESTAETGSIIDNLGNIVNGGLDGIIEAGKSKVTSFFLDWTKASKETEESLSHLMNEFKDGKIPLKDFEDSVGKNWQRVKELKDELDRLTELYKTGRMSTEEYKAATANLEQEIYDLIGDVNSLRDALDQVSAKLQGAKAKQSDLTHAYRSGRMGLHEYTEEYNKYQRVIDDCTEMQINLNGALEDTADAAGDADEKVKGYGDSVEGAGKKSKSAAQEMQDSLVKTLESQLNIFDKFEEKAAMSKEELLSNMQSQINGMTNWANNMDKLSTMGIDKGLYQKLAEMGPQGAQYVGAFVNMTSEEMARANELWAQSLVLPGNVAAHITNSMSNIGLQAGNGLAEGEKKSIGTVQGATEELANDGVIKPAENTLMVSSPSRVFILIGKFIDRGLVLGIYEDRDTVVLAMKDMCEMVVEEAKLKLDPEKFRNIGIDVVKGLTEGLKDESALAELEEASEELGKKSEKSTRKAVDSNSPSKVFMAIGRDIDRGLAIGVTKNQNIVDDAMDEVNNTVLDSMKYTIATIATTLQDGIEDPVITPVLDLSRVSSGIRTLNSAFSTNQALAAAGSMSNLQNGQPVAGVQFIQNNYSPKALSRADIYRQTRNQFAQYRSAML